MRILKTIAASIGVSLYLFVCVGCGIVAIPQGTPNISQVLPQTISAGTKSMTIKVMGSNFANQAIVLWNGNTLTTSVVDSNTLAATVMGSSLASPTVVQLQVQNPQTGKESDPVPVTVFGNSTGATTPPVVAALALTTTSVASGTVGTSYSANLIAMGGTPGYTWNVTSGQLPAGVALGASTGIISGTPTASGTFSFGVTVSDSSSPVQTATATLTMSIAPQATTTPIAPLAITSSAVPAATAGQSYSDQLSATGGAAPYTWSITSGQLPSGLSISPSTGLISGTPTTTGAARFTVTATDSGSPAQTASVQVSIVVGTVAASPLAVTTTSLPSGTDGTAYSQSLQASGGTAPYSWSITSGNLPAGLTLAATTGIISGTPTTSGTAKFTVTATDSGSPVQTASAQVSISVGAIAASPLAITTTTLPSGTDGTAYSQPLQASGGTPAYTWSITSGNLPAGLTLAATTGIISGTPTTTGTSSFTATVSDNGSPSKSQSATMSIALAAATQAPGGPGTTWYVRTDGGTRYSSAMTTGQCDGQADVAYPGTGTNQHCAFNDVRWLWQDGSYSLAGNFPSWGWVISGGDTVIIRGSIGTGVSWRVGWNNSSGALDPSGLYFGLQGDQYNSGIPVPPSGTASQHTRILGENYAACTSQSARTQLHGGWSVATVLNLAGASYVDVGCLDITDFSNCGRDMDTVGCTDGTQDFARYGLAFSNTATHITLSDIRIHGMASDGITGPTGDGFVATDLAIVGNADAGWNADDGDGTTGVGSFFVQNFNISWNGCVEEYPIVDALPYFSCRDDVNGGYGDGFGTASVVSNPPGWQVHFDNGIVSYNTQDGLDAKHVGGAGSMLTITRTLAYGNEGQQFKGGFGAPAVMQNNVIVGNCAALTETIPGRPVTTDDNIGDWCRAGNTAVLINTTPGEPSAFQDNTLFSEGSIGVEVEYATSDFDSTNVLLYNNNVFYGFYNSYEGANPSPIYSAGGVDGAGGTSAFPAVLTNPGASWSNNSYMGAKSNWACPQAGETNAICTDPGLADETYHPYGYGNMAPASGSSAVVGAGVAVPSITLDYTGATRPTPPSIGAYE